MGRGVSKGQRGGVVVRGLTATRFYFSLAGYTHYIYIVYFVHLTEIFNGNTRSLVGNTLASYIYGASASYIYGASVSESSRSALFFMEGRTKPVACGCQHRTSRVDVTAFVTTGRRTHLRESSVQYVHSVPRHTASQPTFALTTSKHKQRGPNQQREE